jgi:predicted Zn-dependent protease
MKSWTLGSVWIAIGLAALAASCRASAALPPLSDKDKHEAAAESKQGADVAAQIAKEGKLSRDQAQLTRVNRIGQRLAAIASTTVIPESTDQQARMGSDRVYPFVWHFYVIKDKDVNAFSLPGGYVYVNSGLLDFVHTDDELAGVLAHEITHAAHHHVAALSHEQSKMSTEMAIGFVAALLAHINPEDMANLYQGAAYTQTGILNNRYSEAAERDADHGGTLIMAKAGFNPVGMLTFMERLAAQEQLSPDVELGILRDHPYTIERVAAIKEELGEMKVGITPQAIRTVSDGPKAAVVPIDHTAAKIVFAGQTLATIADPEGDRAQKAASLLNSLLDSGLQLYQVKAENGELVADDQTVLTFTPADMPLNSGTDTQALAMEACAILRKGLWAQTIKGNSPAY